MVETATVSGAKRRPEPGAYNPPILFLVALIGFCLGILNGIFDALDKVAQEPGKSLGYVLIWISVTALVAAIAAIVIQVKKYMAGKPKPKEGEPVQEKKAGDDEAYEQALRKAKPLIIVCMAAPIIPGALAVVACVHIGLKMVGSVGWLAVLTGGFVP